MADDAPDAPAPKRRKYGARGNTEERVKAYAPKKAKKLKAKSVAKWAAQFSLERDGFFFAKMEEDMLTDMLATYTGLSSLFDPAAPKKSGEWYEYFNTTTSAHSYAGSGRWHCENMDFPTGMQAKIRKLTSAELGPRWREVLPQEISLLATGKNTERQAVHHDSKTVVSSRSTRTAKDATSPVGFAVMPLTDNGTCLDVVRGSHKGPYVVETIPGSSKQCNKYKGTNELTTVVCPYGYILFCHPQLAHAGTATPRDQPLDGRPRFHFYCEATGEKKVTFPVRHDDSFPIHQPALMIDSRNRYGNLKLLPKE